MTRARQAIYIQEDAPEEIAAAIESWWAAEVEHAPQTEKRARAGGEGHRSVQASAPRT